MRFTWQHATLLSYSLTLLTCLDTFSQPVTSEGWAEKSAGRTFYIEVPMIDNKDAEHSGIGGNITAESVINSVRFADAHPDIKHIVFKMDTGGGSLMHAEAMKDVIDRHRQHTAYHIVIQNAISAGIWTAFSCDNIFMCDAGTIGGATAYYHDAKGNSIVSNDIPYIAGKLEIIARSHGYPEQIIKPMMHMPSELHFWVNPDGVKVLSNNKPEDHTKVGKYRQLDAKDTVLTLTATDAVDIGIAKPIKGFDTQLVGEQIQVEGWTLANRYGQVVDEIGYVYNITRQLEDRWSAQKLSLPRLPLTTFNRNNRQIKHMLDTRRKYDAVLDALRIMNTALNELPDIHPERHIYLTDADNNTILADPKQWQADARDATAMAGKIGAGLNALYKAYEDLEIDRSNLSEIADPIRQIATRASRIKSYGNAGYWAKEDE